MRSVFIISISLLLLFNACKKEEETPTVEDLLLMEILAGETVIGENSSNVEIPTTDPFTIQFDKPVDTAQISQKIFLEDADGSVINFAFTVLDNGEKLQLTPKASLQSKTNYFFIITNELRGKSGEIYAGARILFTTNQNTFSVVTAVSGDTDLMATTRATNISLSPTIKITFSGALDRATVSSSSVRVAYSGANIPLSFAFENNDRTLVITTTTPLIHFQRYLLSLTNSITGVDGDLFSGFSKHFYSQLDETPKFPAISDEELLTLVQHQTFNYFWEYGHPVSGMARERNTSGDIVTSGGTGFFLMAIPVAIERGFITREQGVERVAQITGFLEDADRFHGAYSHWLNGSTGAAWAFSTKDNGGDLVETSYLMAGLLAVRQYLNASNSTENDLITRITSIWESVEWTWYTRGGQNVLYWHWSPTYNWDMNMQIKGYNECLITYVLAASSPTYPITPTVYHSGWASNGGIINGNSYYGIPLPLGYSYGGPMFFAHYTFVGLDPRNLQDTYANYWTQNTNHALINYNYCVTNPRNYVGYSDEAWGLTASDNQSGYSAHSPTNDLGVITPTAALASYPYTPAESLRAMRFFYYTLGDKLWGEYGFYDAYNITEGWTASSFLAIDQGPIVVMIENHRTGLVWDLFMANDEVKAGLDMLGFTY